ncbi:MAG: hypothetical protein K9L74_01410 [Candidatus Izimaplasma sp.]|nr:hypothetical protein [Candidatus Izimaplasma bacterium]
MKRLFLAFMIPVLVILGTPALVGSLMYDGSGDEHMPVDLYTEDADAIEMLYAELDASITDIETNPDEDLVYNIHEDIINTAIYQAIKDENPDYSPGEDCSTTTECFAFGEMQQVEGYDVELGLIGAWVSFYDTNDVADAGQLALNLFLQVEANNNLRYKTIVEFHFSFEDDPDYYYLEFEKVKIGRLPVPKSLIVGALGIIENQAGINFENELGEMKLGDIDLQNLSYKLSKDEILQQLNSADEEQNDVGAKLSQELLSISFEKQLIRFDIIEKELQFIIGISQLRNEAGTDMPDYLYTLHDQEVVDDEVVYGEFNPTLFNPETHLKDLFTEYLFNLALTDNNFVIKEKAFNKLIYSEADGFADTREMRTIDLGNGETKTIEFGLKAIWFEFTPDNIYIHALFRIDDIDSEVVITAEEISTSPTELQFEFSKITIGKDEGEADGEYTALTDLEVFKEIFADFGDVEFGEFNQDGDLIISASRLTSLIQGGTVDGSVEVTEIILVQDGIELAIEPTSTTLKDVLQDFKSELNNVIGSEQFTTDLEAVLDTTDGGAEQATYDSIVGLQEALLNEEPIATEDVEELFNNFSELDEQTQTEFVETITNLIDPAIFADYESLFGEFSSEDIPE